ncbi:MAG TPA: hypothetical protein VLJ39_11020, partial [Tepidisphaeraceae bacterium]|nr:hypothetical protein [Tepidisphaeraceae bacterium]
DIIASRTALVPEHLSWTAAGQVVLNHWWLTQVMFSALYSVGGAVLLTMAAGGCALAATILSWRMTSGSSEWRVLLLITLGLTLPEWSIRPQVVSMLFMVLTIRFILAKRYWLALGLLVVWANMHGMVVLGVAVALVPLTDAVLLNRRDLRRPLLLAAGAVVAPLVSPLGLSYWPRVIDTVTVSRGLGLSEYRPALDEPTGWLLALVLAALLGGAIRGRRLITLSPPDRQLILMAIGLAVPALLSLRNVAFFVLAAVPALSKVFPRPARHPKQALTQVGLSLVGAAAVVAIVAVFFSWIEGGASRAWKPIGPAAIAAVKACPDNLFNGLYEGGELIWFVPERPVFVDGRVEVYPHDFLLRTRQAERAGDYQSLFSEYGIRCAVIHRDSPMYPYLQRDPAFTSRFSDSRWAVFVR